MKIIIDTKEESKEDIKKIIRLLSVYVKSDFTEGNFQSNDEKDNVVPTPSSSAFNMFGSNDSNSSNLDSGSEENNSPDEDPLSDIQILPY